MGAPRSLIGLLAIAFIGGLPSAAHAQCTVASGPVAFEPGPPGAARPSTLSSGFSTSLAIYAHTGSPRMMMNESFGYSILDLADPLSPFALGYDDLRFEAVSPTSNPVPAAGDGQSYIQVLGVSVDGERVAFSVSGPAEPTWHNLVGRPGNGEGFGMWGDFGLSRASGIAVQRVGSRYLAYASYSTLSMIAADVTVLPTANAEFQSLNLPSEQTSFPPGLQLSLSGNYLVYLTSSGVQVIDASNPGPIGSITSGFKTRAITSIAGDPLARPPVNFAAAIDPADPTKLWLLLELAAGPQEHAPSYALVSITPDGSGNLQLPVAAGPLFEVPAAAGETWGRAGNSSALVASNGQLFALMWATRVLPSQAFVLHSAPVAAWGQSVATTVSAPGFGLAATGGRTIAGAGERVYQYLPTGPRAFVVPLTCVAPAQPDGVSTSGADGGILPDDAGSSQDAKTGCGCGAGGDRGATAALGFVLLAAFRRRRRVR